MNLFAQIRKVDEEKRLVFGRAAEEAVDKADEIMDYASSKPHFVKWSEEVAKDTDGKSLGNVRAMHGKVAAGKLTAIDFNDADKAIDVCAKVVDDGEWKKVCEGIYTGFSIGGSYVGDKKVEKADGRDVTRYTARPTEVSLVDRPCMKGAKFFEVQKADGSVQKVEFKAPEADDVTVNGTADEVAALGKLMNENGLSLADVLGKALPAFLEAKKKKGDAKADDKADDKKDAAKTDAAADLKKVTGSELRKNFYSCSELAQLLASLQGLKSSTQWNAYYEGDKSSIPARIGAVMALAGQVLKEMIDEELGEAPGSSLEMSEKAAGLAKFEGDPLVTLLKVGARNSAADTERLGKIHALTVELGHECAGAAKVDKFLTASEARALLKVDATDKRTDAEVLAAATALRKAEADQALAKAESDRLSKIVADAVAPMQKLLDDATTKIAKLEAQPAPARIALRAVAKSDDLIRDDKPAPAPIVKDDHGEVHEAAGLIKSVHASGGAPLAKPF